MEQDYDVIVVGARCAGSATARLLAQQGVRTLAVDRATFPSDTVSTHAINAAGIVMLQRWGLFEAVKATNVPHVIGLGVKFGETDLPEAPFSSGGVGTICPRRTVLDALLVDAARDAGAEVREGTTVKELLWEDGAVAGIRAVGDDGAFEARAPLVIGADGLHSFVAKAVGAEEYDERPARNSGCYAYFSGTETDKPNLAFNDRQFGFAFPTNDAMLCLGTGGADERFADLAGGGDEAMAANLEIASPRLAADMRRGKRETRWFSFRAQPGRFRRPYGPGWALVGDAGYYKDPVTGLGISDAFIGAQLLSDAVVSSLGTAGLDDALRGYHERRDALAADLYDITHQFADLQWTNDDLFEMFLRFGAALAKELDDVADVAAA
jgi:flavin-dependent dehydrogenase